MSRSCAPNTTLKGWLRVVGLLRRACGGEEEDGGGGGGGTRDTTEISGDRRPPPPPGVAFELALQVCVLCERPDAGLEVLNLMRSTGLQAGLEAYKVRSACGAGQIGDGSVTDRSLLGKGEALTLCGFYCLLPTSYEISLWNESSMFLHQIVAERFCLLLFRWFLFSQLVELVARHARVCSCAMKSCVVIGPMARPQRGDACSMSAKPLLHGML